MYALVFMVKVESDGNASINSADLKLKKLDSSYGAHSRVIGMRAEMEEESGSGLHWIHLIVYSSLVKKVWYLRITPESIGNVYAHQISSGTDVVGNEAVFIGSLQ